MRKKKFPTYEYYDRVIDRFGEDIEDSSQLGGTNEKIFVRMDSSFFSEYFDAVRDPKCSYVTYIDDALDDYKKTGKLPLSALSVLYKTYVGPFATHYSINEEIASRIGNAMGIPVVYNKYIYGEDKKQYERDNPTYNSFMEFLQHSLSIFDKKHHNVSIDFMKYDGTIYHTLYDGYLNRSPKHSVTHRNSSLKDWFRIFLFADMKAPFDDQPVSMINRKQLTKEFISAYLFRKYILSDCDFDVHNIMIGHNLNTDKHHLTANFDMERSFFRKWDEFEFEMCLKQDLMFAYTAYPEIVDEFMIGVEALKGQYMDITKRIEYPLYRSDVRKKLKSSIDIMEATYNQVKNNPNLEKDAGFGVDVNI